MGIRYNQRVGGEKFIEILSIPHRIVTAGTTPVHVGKGNLCRIKGTAGGFVRFAAEGDSTTPSVTTAETLETEAGYFFVRASNDYIIASADMRCEVTHD